MIQEYKIFESLPSLKKIQAVWIEIENNADRPLLLLPTAIDPNYLAPLEVAFAYHNERCRRLMNGGEKG